LLFIGDIGREADGFGTSLATFFGDCLKLICPSCGQCEESALVGLLQGKFATDAS